MYGPLLLQAVGTPDNDSGYWQLSLYKDLKLDGDYATAAIKPSEITASGDPIFTVDTPSGKLTMRPYHISDGQAVSSYFRRAEPNVVFGSVDTGVPNRKRNDGLPNYDVPVTNITSPGTDGLTFLDVVWDKAPFGSKDDFVAAVTVTAKAFGEAGLFSAKEQDTIVSGAASADL